MKRAALHHLSGQPLSTFHRRRLIEDATNAVADELDLSLGVRLRLLIIDSNDQCLVVAIDLLDELGCELEGRIENTRLRRIGDWGRRERLETNGSQKFERGEQLGDGVMERDLFASAGHHELDLHGLEAPTSR